MVEKADTSCPHCGHVQKEPLGAISTFCRACGEHFEIAPPPAQPHRRPTRKPAPVRTVHCHHCGSNHDVSPHAKSTLCPACGTGIELTDILVTAPTSRPVNIRGKLTVRPSGSLNSSDIVCTDALIEGRITGTLTCENHLALRSSGKLSFSATAASTSVAKGVRIELASPLTTASLDLAGELHGDVRCSGPVRIRKSASLTGNIQAAALTVDRGGFWSGTARITAQSPPPPDSPSKQTGPEPNPNPHAMETAAQSGSQHHPKPSPMRGPTSTVHSHSTLPKSILYPRI